MFYGNNSLLGMYHELKEAGNADSWPSLLGNVMFKKLLRVFKAMPSPWRQYTDTGDLADFKVNDRVILGEAPDLEIVLDDGEYKDWPLGEDKYQIQVQKRGRQFVITREAVINDDLKGLTDIPVKMGRAAGRTLAKKVVSILEADNNAYDNQSLFATRTAAQGGQNFGVVTLANTSAGQAALAVGMAVIRKARDPQSGELTGATPRMQIVPPELEDVALRVTNSSQLWPISTTGGGTGNVGTTRRLDVVVEPYLTSATKSYIASGREEFPFCEVGFLQGVEEPSLLVKKAEAMSVVGGGDDPFGYDFDDISYKCRHEWGIAAAFYQGIYRMGA